MWHKKECAACQALREQNQYLRTLVEKLLFAQSGISMAPPEPPREKTREEILQEQSRVVFGGDGDEEVE